MWKSSSGHASHVIGICVFRVRRCQTLTCAAAPTVVFVRRAFETHLMSRVSSLSYILDLEKKKKHGYRADGSRFRKHAAAMGSGPEDHW